MRARFERQMASLRRRRGQRIREARERNRPELSQEDAAHEMGVSVKTIGRWERGESQPRDKQWEPLARMLKVGVEDLRGQPPIAPEAELKAQLDRIEANQQLLLAYFGIEPDEEGEPATRFADAFSGRRVSPAKPSRTAAAKTK
jgi:DNA-binding XRE family transcriptional regulator